MVNLPQVAQVIGTPAPKLSGVRQAAEPLGRSPGPQEKGCGEDPSRAGPPCLGSEI